MTELLRFCLSIIFVGLILAGATSAGFASDQKLSQTQQKETKPPESEPKAPAKEPALDSGNETIKTTEEPKPAENDLKHEEVKIDIDDIEIPEIIRDLSQLPFPARRMHQLLLDAAKSGDIEKLRPYIGHGDDVTMLSLGGIDEDPIAFLKSLSGDSDGHEVLAILTEILESGFVHYDQGSEEELFVWPYFFAYPLDKLTPAQRVELFTLVTHGDYEDMQSFGAYIFYRVGISPKGRWQFFVAGD